MTKKKVTKKTTESKEGIDILSGEAAPASPTAPKTDAATSSSPSKAKDLVYCGLNSKGEKVYKPINK